MRLLVSTPNVNIMTMDNSLYLDPLNKEVFVFLQQQELPENDVCLNYRGLDQFDS